MTDAAAALDEVARGEAAVPPGLAAFTRVGEAAAALDDRAALLKNAGAIFAEDQVFKMRACPRPPCAWASRIH